MRAAFSCIVASGASNTASNGITAIKVCGIVTARDAEMISQMARDQLQPSVRLMLGMILWPGSRRSVDRVTAKDIATVAREAGAVPVGVFVDESTHEISVICEDAEISIAQLHGKKCRNAVQSTRPPEWLSVVDVVDVHSDGSLVEPSLPLYHRPPLWRLYDAKGGGTGRAFDWTRFDPPSDNWFLAGGLTPENVEAAITKLHPKGLDVASGVAKPDGLAKCESRLREFFLRTNSATIKP